MNIKPLTDKEISYIQENFENLSFRDIASFLNRSPAGIRKICLKLNLIKPSRLWTETEINFIKANHGILTFSQMAYFLNKSTPCIKEYAKKLGLKGAPRLNFKYWYNQNAFSEFSLESARVAGFIAADGCIFPESANSNSYRLKIALARIDLDYLKNIQSFFDTDSPIKIFRKSYVTFLFFEFIWFKTNENRFREKI